MDDLKIKLPKSLKSEKLRLERYIEDIVIFEEKRKNLLKFIDEFMKGAKNIDDEELVKLGRKLKKGRLEKLNI